VVYGNIFIMQQWNEMEATGYTQSLSLWH